MPALLGVLQAVDVRQLLREIDCPVIVVHSTQDALARPVHAEPFVDVSAVNLILKENSAFTTIVSVLIASAVSNISTVHILLYR